MADGELIYAPILSPYRTARRASAAGGGTNVVDIEKYENVIRMITQANGVVRDGGEFKPVLSITEAVPEFREMINASLVHANASRNQVLFAQAGAAGKTDDAVKRIGDVGKALETAPEIVKDAQAVVHGAKASAHWWGVTVELTGEAAKALSNLLTKDLAPFTGLLSAATASVPVVAAVLAILGALTAAFAQWISAANKSEKGVAIGLYFWLVPWVSPL